MQNCQGISKLLEVLQDIQTVLSLHSSCILVLSALWRLGDSHNFLCIFNVSKFKSFLEALKAEWLYGG